MELGGSRGGACSPPLENEPDRLRSAIPTCARVSKTDGSRSLDLQRDVLETAGVDEVDVYHDLASGVRDDAAGLDSRQGALCKGNVLVVWKVDRVGRNLARLVDAVQDLPARGVRVVAEERGADPTPRRRPAALCRAVAGAGPVGCGAKGGVMRTPGSAGMRRTA